MHHDLHVFVDSRSWVGAQIKGWAAAGHTWRRSKAPTCWVCSVFYRACSDPGVIPPPSTHALFYGGTWLCLYISLFLLHVDFTACKCRVRHRFGNLVGRHLNANTHTSDKSSNLQLIAVMSQVSAAAVTTGSWQADLILWHFCAFYVYM